MKKITLAQKKLQEILSQKKIDQLDPFKSQSTWKTLSHNDRDLLASLFILRGEKQLGEGDPNAIESFELASKVSEQNPEVHCRIGHAYAKYPENIACLKHAEGAYRKSLTLEEQHAQARIGLGKVYNALGILNQDPRYFSKAEETFQLASATALDQEQRSNLLAAWAVSWFFLGRNSGEASDYLTALGKLREAADLGCNEKEFWCLFGDTLGELSSLLGKQDLWHEIIEYYRNAIRQSLDFYEGWLKLGCAYQRLYEFNFHENDFNQANECFRMASEINDSHSLLWTKWAQLLATAGKAQHQEQLLIESFAKFEKADACEPSQPIILCCWAQALILYGSHTDNVYKLQEARQKIIKSLELDYGSIDAWYCYGNCLIELGRYFADEDYFQEAVEKFEYALTLNEQEPLLWHGLALAQFALGDIRVEAQWLEKSVLCFTKVVERTQWQPRQFWNDWGVALMKLAEMTHERFYVEEAIEKFKQALGDLEEQEPDPEWLYNYGCSLDFLGDFNEDIDCYEQAIAALTRALQMDPGYSHARYNLALTYAHLGEIAMDVECFHKSIEHFQVLISQDPEDEMGWNDYGLTLMHLADLIYDHSRPEQTFKLYEVAESKLLQAAALGCLHAYYHLACLYSLCSNHSLAMHFLEKAEASDVLPPLEEILHDDWLDGIRNTPGFRQFISHFPKPKDRD